MHNAMLQLKQLVSSIHPISNEDWITFSGVWQPYTAKRKELITETGNREKYLYFVVDGVQRVYYADEQNREATIVFTYPPSFGGVVDSLMLQQPSRYFYEALTASVFLRASYSELSEIMRTRPAIELMIRHGITYAFSGVLERLAEIQCYSSEEKFVKLLQRSPHILQLVPHKYLATYLGMDATNFSKLMNKVQF